MSHATLNTVDDETDAIPPGGRFALDVQRYQDAVPWIFIAGAWGGVAVYQFSAQWTWLGVAAGAAVSIVISAGLFVSHE